MLLNHFSKLFLPIIINLETKLEKLCNSQLLNILIQLYVVEGLLRSFCRCTVNLTAGLL